MRVFLKEDDFASRTLARQLRLGHASERNLCKEALLTQETELDTEVVITDVFMPDAA